MVHLLTQGAAESMHPERGRIHCSGQGANQTILAGSIKTLHNQQHPITPIGKQSPLVFLQAGQCRIQARLRRVRKTCWQTLHVEGRS